MNLNLRAEKTKLLPNISKLCYYNRIFRFLYQTEKLFFQKKFHISCVYYLLSRRRVKFVYCKRLWKTQEKIKFQFIQEPRIYLPVKSLNPQIFYIINIMNFSKFTQEIYIYLLVASLYLIQTELKIFIHSFISSQLPRPNE